MRRTIPLVVTGIITVISLSCSVSEAQTALFAPAPDSPIEVPRGPTNVLTLNLNSDKNIDLLVPSWESRSISVLLGKGDGTFDVQPSAITLPEAAGEMAIGEINGDGKP